MNKKKLFLIIAGACVAVCVIAGTVIGVMNFHKTKISINDKVYERTVTQLDLSGVTAPELDQVAQLTKLTQLNLKNTGISIGEYEKIAKALPGCEILWSVPFQGGYCDNDSALLTVSQLSQEDLKLFDYFRSLNRVDATLCSDYDQLAALIEARPEVMVDCSVPLAGSTVKSTATEVTVQNANIPELTYALKLLPKMQSVRLEGQLPDAASLQKLRTDNPDIHFYWEYPVHGVIANSDMEELDLSYIQMQNVDTVENALPYLPSLKKVIMCECGISNEEMDALGKRNPEVRFVWTVWVSQFKLRTDVKAFIPAKYGTLPSNNGCYNLRYCVDMECLDLGHAPLYNCEFVRYMPNITYLLLGETNISDLSPLENKEKLIYLEIFMCNRITDLSPLLTLKNLEDLNMCYLWNGLEVVGQMTWLKNLWWSHGPGYFYRKDMQIAYLTPRLTNTRLEFDAGSSTGGGWRELPNYYAQRDMLGMPYFIG